MVPSRLIFRQSSSSSDEDASPASGAALVEPVHRDDDADATLLIGLEHAPRSNADSLLGKTIDSRYLIRSRIGKGGMGAVYHATQAPLDRHVAIKVLEIQAQPGESIENFKTRFFREASILSKIQHPNVVTLLDYGQVSEDGTERFYMVMELLKGETLSSRLMARGRLSQEECLSIARQVGRGLREAHRLGFIHRDLKPSNIMLVPENDDELVKLVDFGIGKSIFADTSSAEELSGAGLLLGTPSYMAPEQITGNPVESRTDLYGLGVVLFQCLTGKLPFSTKDHVEMMLAPCVTPAPSIAQACPEEVFFESVIFLVEQLLQKDIAARPTMDQFFQYLADCEEQVLGVTPRSVRALSSGSRPKLRERTQSSGSLPRIFESVPSSVPSAPVVVHDPDSHDTIRTRTLSAPPELAKAVLENTQPRSRPNRWKIPIAAAAVVLGSLAVVVGTRVVPALRDSAASETLPSSFSVHLNSEPTGAVVTENGRELGMTPLVMVLDRRNVPDARRSFTLRKSGYRAATFEQRLSDSNDLTVVIKLTPESNPNDQGAPKP
jgi:serine/threonine protein kinase